MSTWRKCTPPENEQDLIRAFDILFAALEPETDEELETLLRAEGLDLDEVVAEGRVIIAEAIAQSPFNWRNRAPQERQQAKPSSLEARIAALEMMVTEQGTRLTAHECQHGRATQARFQRERREYQNEKGE